MENALKLIEPGTEIATLETLETKQPNELLPYFQTNGLDALIDRIRQEAMAFKGDISTDKGRKGIASYAHQVAKAKTAIEKLGKASIADLKASVQAVDKERIRGVAAIQEIQDAVRKPLTDWEEKEKARVQAHNDALADIGRKIQQVLLSPIADMEAFIAEISSDTRDWQEFTERAKEAKANAITATNNAIEARKKHEAEQAELARLRQAEAERKQREHEEKIAAEAAEKARKEAEAEAAAEKSRIEAEQRKQELERQRIGREKQEAIDRAARAEREKEKAAKKAEADRIAAEAKAEREKQEAIQEERDRAAEQQRQEAEAAVKREADRVHQAKIHNDILAALIAVKITEIDARVIITAIAKGEIPHVRIAY